MSDAELLFAIITVTLGLFIWGYWRYDVVAGIALMACVILGLIPAQQAFSGFSSPAVVTVAAVMAISAAISDSGVLDYFMKEIIPAKSHVVWHVGILTLLAAVLSAFMNNVGALALIMPAAIQSANNNKLPPSIILMPIAFGSVLGGLSTAIGTPPNLLISSLRQDVTGVPYQMFDFSPVGVVIAVIGVLFIAVLGWRLLPERKAPLAPDERFQLHDYITEVTPVEKANALGQPIRKLHTLIDDDITIVGIIRSKRKRLIIPPDMTLEPKDILIVEAGHDELQTFMKAGQFELVTGEKVSTDVLRSEEISVVEAVVAPSSRLEGRTSKSMRLKYRYGVNLLAIAHEGRPVKQRLNETILRAGDVILLQGETGELQESISRLGLLPLVERGVKVGLKSRAVLPILIFVVAILATATRLLTVPIAFSGALLAMVLLNIMPIRRVYDSIDWSIITLLGAIIPVGMALKTTGGTLLIADWFTNLSGHSHPIVIISLIMLVTMTLSDVMNNAATAVVMGPIAITIAHSLNMSIDPFLMAVAVGASCSFLTPIAHQNNTLVMGPGGYKFSDYWRMGLPLEILVLIVGVPAILLVWPI